MSAATDLLTNYQHIIKSLTFTTGSKGIFDVTVDGDVLFSKYASERYANEGEVLSLFAETYANGVKPYGE